MKKMKMHAIVSGKVQGVFFRANTADVANRLGVTGYVRNLSDGKVEVVAEGSHDKLLELLKWLHRGSIWAQVDAVQHEFSENEEEDFMNFTIHY
ncbi:MAG: acylphosphatase [Candidatus Lokiarchaeota archaeon]|nr:acylphosphatase [Candidatus Lokiarchaeota archaeon]